MKQFNIFPLTIAAFAFICFFAREHNPTACRWSKIVFFFCVLLGLAFAAGRNAKTRDEVRHTALRFGFLSTAAFMTGAFLTASGYFISNMEYLYIGIPATIAALGLFLLFKRRGIEILWCLGEAPEM